MKLKSLKIKNFRALQNVQLVEIPELAVLVGANGTGKSTLFDVFAFLRDALETNVRRALDVRGRYAEVVTRGHENEPIAFELQLSQNTESDMAAFRYQVEIGLRDGVPVVSREVLSDERGSQEKTINLLDFKNGEGVALSNGQLSREEQTLENPDILALKGLGQFQNYKVASAVRQWIENWHVSNFQVTVARGRKDMSGSAEHLSESGDNLAFTARHLFENHPETFKSILERMRASVPGIENISPEVTQDGYLTLRYKDGSFKTPFLDRYVSDGTIKLFAYLVLLHDPQPHSLLCIEEPENQIYPSLMHEFAEEFRSYAAHGGQVMISTHSPDMLNAVELDEVLWLVKRNGVTEIHKASENQQVKRYVEDGDKMGTLWKQGFFTDVNPRG